MNTSLTENGMKCNFGEPRFVWQNLPLHLNDQSKGVITLKYNELVSNYTCYNHQSKLSWYKTTNFLHFFNLSLRMHSWSSSLLSARPTDEKAVRMERQVLFFPLPRRHFRRALKNCSVTILSFASQCWMSVAERPKYWQKALHSDGGTFWTTWWRSWSSVGLAVHVCVVVVRCVYVYICVCVCTCVTRNAYETTN